MCFVGFRSRGIICTCEFLFAVPVVLQRIVMQGMQGTTARVKDASFVDSSPACLNAVQSENVNNVALRVYLR